MSAPAVKTLSFAELEALEERDGLRYELWNGHPVAMTGGTRAHNLIALGLRDVIRPQFLAAGCQVFVADFRLRLSEADDSDSAYPDLMVVCGGRDNPLYETRPVLLAEVLSDSSAKRDRNNKFKAYTSLESLEVYLILAQTAVEVEVYRRATGWSEEIYRGDAVIELTQPSLRLPLRAVYEDVWNDLTGSR